MWFASIRVFVSVNWKNFGFHADFLENFELRQQIGEFQIKTQDFKKFCVLKQKYKSRIGTLEQHWTFHKIENVVSKWQYWTG